LESYLYKQDFGLRGHSLKVVTNDSRILEGFGHWLPSLDFSESGKSVDYYVWRLKDRFIPLIMPQNASFFRSGRYARHFHYRGLWLLDIKDVARMVVDRKKMKALVFVLPHFGETEWLADALLQPYFELLRTRGLYGIHSSAVSLSGKGLLIAAEKWSGKSTLAIRLTSEGSAFLSDECCFLRQNASGYELLGFPEPVKLYPPNVADLPEFQFLQLMVDAGEKIKFPIKRVYPDAVVDAASLQAIIFPHWNGAGKSRLETLAPFDALVRLLPLTMVQAVYPEVATAHLQFLGDLVEAVPCYSFHLGGDKEVWATLVKRVLLL
jgi:hypothetical protein